MARLIFVFVFVLLIAAPALAGTPPLVENGDGTGTLTLTYQTFNWLEVCAGFNVAFMSCANELDTDGDGTLEQWAVVAGHCTQQQADDGVLIGTAKSATCAGANVTNNRCRDASDPGPDQSGYTIPHPGVCQDFIAGRIIAWLRTWRDRGILVLEATNNPLGTPPAPLED